MLDKSFLPRITAAAVSSQLDSSPKITGLSLIIMEDKSYIVINERAHFVRACVEKVKVNEILR